MIPDANNRSLRHAQGSQRRRVPGHGCRVFFIPALHVLDQPRFTPGLIVKTVDGPPIHDKETRIRLHLKACREGLFGVAVNFGNANVQFELTVEMGRNFIVGWRKGYTVTAPVDC